MKPAGNAKSQSRRNRELALKINVPEAAEDADYHAALVIESETSGLLSGSGSVAGPRSPRRFC